MLAMNDAEILQRLSDLSIELPDPPKAVAAYVPVRIAGDVAYVAGQVPVVDGEVVHPGTLGDPDLRPDPGGRRARARQAALQVLSALREGLGGSFERLAGISQVTVYLATPPTSSSIHRWPTGASQLLVDVLGEEGRHARAADRDGLAPARRERRGGGGGLADPVAREPKVAVAARDAGPVEMLEQWQRELTARLERLAERAHRDAVGCRAHDHHRPVHDGGVEDQIGRHLDDETGPCRGLDHAAFDAGSLELIDRGRHRGVLAPMASSSRATVSSCAASETP
jgi:enamine deaminase RidA (YjgF/YER057c/UK114 family)